MLDFFMVQCARMVNAGSADARMQEIGSLQQARDILGADAAGRPPKRLSLALQGGGSFGAFT
jgi:predicted acylesterase/phospholipase RssA